MRLKTSVVSFAALIIPTVCPAVTVSVALSFDSITISSVVGPNVPVTGAFSVTLLATTFGLLIFDSRTSRPSRSAAESTTWVNIFLGGAKGSAHSYFEIGSSLLKRICASSTPESISISLVKPFLSLSFLASQLPHSSATSSHKCRLPSPPMPDKPVWEREPFF